jgi:hypothetical protein
MGKEQDRPTSSSEGGRLVSSTTIAVDAAKPVFEVAISTRPGRVAERHRLSRTQSARFLATRAPATVLFEACGMAH